MDTVDKETRSKIMSRVGKRDTAPEMSLRKALHRLGLRYTLYNRKLPGSPDLVFPKYKAVVFVHGCFWHNHGCRASSPPKTNEEFWLNKFERNKKRDLRNKEDLINSGWRVLIVWECAIRRKKVDLEEVSATVGMWIKSNKTYGEMPSKVLPSHQTG